MLFQMVDPFLDALKRETTRTQLVLGPFEQHLYVWLHFPSSLGGSEVVKSILGAMICDVRNHWHAYGWLPWSSGGPRQFT